MERRFNYKPNPPPIKAKSLFIKEGFREIIDKSPVADSKYISSAQGRDYIVTNILLFRIPLSPPFAKGDFKASSFKIEGALIISP